MWTSNKHRISLHKSLFLNWVHCRGMKLRWSIRIWLCAKRCAKWWWWTLIMNKIALSAVWDRLFVWLCVWMIKYIVQKTAMTILAYHKRKLDWTSKMKVKFGCWKWTAIWSVSFNTLKTKAIQIISKQREQNERYVSLLFRK